MKRAKLHLFWILLTVLPATSMAAPPVTDEYEQYFQSAADEVGVPVALTKAIARVESRTSPYALNVEGKSYIYSNKAEALAAAYRAEAAGSSFDGGIMQINNWWLQRYRIPLEALWEPHANILLGSWILKQALDGSGGDIWAGVGRYHSPSATRGAHYARLVRRAMLREQQGKKDSKTKKSKPQQLMATAQETNRQEYQEYPTNDALVVYRQQQTVFTRTKQDADVVESTSQHVFVRRMQ